MMQTLSSGSRPDWSRWRSWGSRLSDSRIVLVVVMVLLSLLTLSTARADVPLRNLPSGAAPNPGTQQQELANITAPAEWNVFEFVVTCGACHSGTVDQHVGHFGNWAGGNMASAARDPVFRAAQISTNNAVRSMVGQDGAGNVCFRCHSPNGWLSGRFDPTMGGKADGSSLIQSILLSTDGEGVMCETCHRAVGAVTYKRQDPTTPASDPTQLSLLDRAWNLLSGLFDWEHGGREPTDQAGTPTIGAGNPMGDTTLQFLDGMTYIGKYSGMSDIYFSDLPIGGSYTGQIYAVYPDWWVAAGYPMNPAPAGQPSVNSAGQTLAYNLDGTLPPLFEVPVGTPVNAMTGAANFNAQALSIEHPTVGGAGRKTSATDTTNSLLPVVPAGPGGSVSPNNFIRTSEFCGSCHELTVPVLNHGMPEQRTYSEWKYSAYAKPGNQIADPLNKRTGTGVERCQDCHMPTLRHEYTDNDPGSYNADPWLVGGFPYGKNRSAQGGTALHKLTGANRDLPEMMKVLYPEVDLEVIGAPTGKDPRVFPGMLSDRGPMYDRARRNTEITLRDGVDVRITQAPTELAAQPGIYEMKVRVTNRSGHRIPSGYPDGRRFWLAVSARNGAAEVYRSGHYDATTAELKTTAAQPLNRALSPVIDATAGANAVMVYERVTGTCTDAASVSIFPDPTAGQPAACTPSPSVLNNFILFDNRIPPKGFDAAQARLAGVKFWNYGTGFVPFEDAGRYSAAQQAGGYDEVTYRFAAAPGLALTASAEVHWQTHTREFMEHLRHADTSTVRPEGPPNPFDPNYPNVPNYLSQSINGQPLSAYTALDGTALNDNWGGIAYAAWLATGKGVPFQVDRDDTAVATAPAVPVLTVRALQPADPEYMDPVTMAPDPFAARIEWQPVAGADGYMIWIRYGKSDTTADWDRLAVVGADVTSHTEHVLGDASAASPGKTYGFKVVAFNGQGETASTVVNHTVASALPAAPTSLTASNVAPGSTGNQITLQWLDNADNEIGFEIWRYGPMSVNGQPVVYNGMPPLTIVGGTAAVGAIGTQTGGPAVPTQTVTGANTYLDSTGLLPNACYNYQVRAVTANVDVSTFALAPSMGCTVAAVPMVNLTAAAAGGYRVDLGWTSNVTAAVSYRISRGTVVMAALAATVRTWSDSSALPATAYTYKVEALDAGGVVLATASMAVTTPAVPLAPTGLKATVAGTQINLSWIDNAGNEDGFVLERAPVVNGVVGAYQQIPAVGAFLAPNTVGYVDSSALEAQSSVYRIKAIHLVNGDSTYAIGNTVTVGLYAPIAPKAVLVLPPLATTVQVAVSWTDVSQKETGYKVERRLGTAAWTVVAAALPANSVQFTDSTVPQATKASSVQYRITALSGTLASLPALTTAVAVPAKAAVPTKLAVTSVGVPVKTLKVTFTVATTAAGYEVRRRIGAAGAWATIASAVGTGAVTVTDVGLVTGTSYTYSVRAYNGGGWSAWSAVKSAVAK